MSRPLNRIAVIGAVAVLATLGVTQGLRLYQTKTQEHREFVDPANKLAERMAAAEKHGLVIATPSRETTSAAGNELLAKVPELTLKHRAIFDSSEIQYLSMSDLGSKVSVAPELITVFDSLAAATEFTPPVNPSPQAILETGNHNPERVTVRVLCGLATHAAEKGDHKKAAEYLAGAGRINEYLTTLSEDVSVVAWFGNSRMIASTILDILSAGPVSLDQKTLYRDLVKDVASAPKLETVIAGDILRHSQAAKGLKEFDELELVQLNTTGLNDGPLPTHPQAADAMISQVLAFWGTTMEIVKQQSKSAFQSGVIIDGLTREWQKDLQPSNYMLRTMPVTYEQVGRTITRGEQLWQAMNALMAEVCGETATADTGLTVSKEGNQINVSVSDPDKKFVNKARRGVDIDQATGVQLSLTLG